MKVLVVDDSLAIRIVQRNILLKLGYDDVSEAGDGVEALKKIKADTPDLVLIDWYMPNMDGLGLVKAIRETDEDLPLIMVTTEVETEKMREAIREGINGYVVKPFTPETIAKKIKQVLDPAGVP